MTTPFERTRAALRTREFLFALTSPSRTPFVPEVIRQHAAKLLEHYPTAVDLDLAHDACPDWFGPTE